jgi:hypothetical protein
MTMPTTCLAIDIPPPESEATLSAALRQLFPSLEPGMLAPFFETGDTLYLSSADKPALHHAAQLLRACGLQISACGAPDDLHTERSLVMPHPEAPADPGRRVVIQMGRRQPAAPGAVMLAAPFQDPHPAELAGRTQDIRCPRCREPQFTGVPFCPFCGHEPPAAPAVLHYVDIRLPTDQRRHRVLGWLAQATGRTIPSLRPGTGNSIQVQLLVPPDVIPGFTRYLAGWGAVVTAETDPPRFAIHWGPRDAGLGIGLLMTATFTSLPHVLGAGFLALGLGGWAYLHRDDLRLWRTGAPPTIQPEAACRLASPMPAELLADLQACLADTTGSGLQPAVRRTLSLTAGIFGAMGATDAVSQHLWQDLEPQVQAVVSGILALVRRGRQVEQYLHDHGATAVDHEVRRLERLIERTSDPVSRSHYTQALEAARKTQKRRQDALLAAERLGSQLLVLLHGLGDVQATVAMSGLNNASAAAPLLDQLRRLQRDTQAADEALQELMP